LLLEQEKKMAALVTNKGKVIQDPPLAQWLFNHPLAAWLWLPLRIWLGWQWIEAASHKLGNPAWVRTGEALKGFWMGAIKVPEAPARPPIAFDWYRGFIQGLVDAQAYTWFAKVVAYGEMLVGIGLILGAFVGVAAFFGALMNWNFMMAGSASTNPLLLVIAIGLILAWKVAGYLGADYFLLRWIGTPWGRSKSEPEASQASTPAQERGLAGAD
jgi:thiosulfate dehydrogenase [quinone] large subunit